ncbi:hypothetical protein NQL31_006659 [Lotmaria passim]
MELAEARHGEVGVSAASSFPLVFTDGIVSRVLCTRGSAYALHRHRSGSRFLKLCQGNAATTALRVQCRCSATLSPASASAVSEDEFRQSFFRHPLTQRVGAVTVAKYQLAALQQKRQQKNAAEPMADYMPMFDFVRRVSPLVRDEIFRGQLNAVQWVEAAAPLLQLVDESGNAVAASAARIVTSPEKRDDATAPSYNPLLHVRVTVDPAWVVKLMELQPADGGSSSCSAAARSILVSPRGSQGETEKEEVKEAVLSALRHFEERVMGNMATFLGQQRSHTTDAAAKVTLCRYAPLVDLLKTIHCDAAAESGNSLSTMPASTQALLRSLEIGTLEQVVDAWGLPVTVGRRSRRDMDPEVAMRYIEYPSLSAKPLWVVRANKLPGQPRTAVFVALRRASDTEAPRFSVAQPRVTTATPANNYGGWGGADVVPTKTDVYEILKYIPVNWGTFGNLNIPAEVKRRHIRCSSSLQWFRRQPYYFELRNLCGSVEIRRSAVLHPEARGLTREEAAELLELQLATGEANNLVLLTGDGVPADDSESPLERAAVKFLLRVCPTYFAPMSLVAQRYTKKNLSEAAMLAMARRRPQEFEELTTRFSDVVLVRRRGGADSSRWRAAFVADLEKYPEDVRGIMVLCNRMCPSWDRPEFIYVRLSPSEQEVIGGYAGAVRILQRHPMIFRVGKHFVCRADPSNPLTMQEVEPAHDDVTARSFMREENPYNSALDVALVFHYVAPDSEPCTAAYLADCASPAIRSVLPTRIVTIVQQFPKLFACTETSPGVFAIRKLKQRVRKPTPSITGIVQAGRGGSGDNGATSTATPSDAQATSAGASDDDDLIQMLEEEIAEEEHLTREEVVAAVRALVPETGVEASQLLLWASTNVQRAANEHFGGVLKLVEALPQHFRVVTTEETKTIYKA